MQHGGDRQPGRRPPTTSSGLCAPRQIRATLLQAASTIAATLQRRGSTSRPAIANVMIARPEG
jgi:hypothetical protein